MLGSLVRMEEEDSDRKLDSGESEVPPSLSPKMNRIVEVSSVVACRSTLLETLETDLRNAMQHTTQRMMAQRQHKLPVIEESRQEF